MADKAISELVAATQVQPSDLFVLEQSGAAKKLTGQILENWLLSFADGHGGIQSITKIGTSGLKDTYRITLADETYQDIQVTNGRGITGFAKTGTSGLVDTWRVSYNDGTYTDISVTNGRGITKNELVSTSGLVKTYRITYNDGTTQTYTVTDGAKGDKGDNTYTHIKYASQKPTEASHSMGDVPDAWMGIYTGALATAPTDWTLYKWNKVKGEQGDTGNPATLVSSSVTYLVSDRGDIVPSGSWSTTIPTVAPGKYLWTRVITTFNSGSPVTSYSVARMGIDGTGSVSSVNSQNPDSTGNVKLTAADIAGSDGQSVEAALAGKQAEITSVGLLKGTGNGGVTDAVAGTDYQTPLAAGDGIAIDNGQVKSKLRTVDGIEPDDDGNVATGALPKAGGTMTGNINMGGMRIYGLSEPNNDSDAATKNYVDGKRLTYTGTLDTYWPGSGPYSHSFQADGVVDTDMPHITPVYSDDNATAIAQKEAWGCVSKAVAANGWINFYCFEEKPTTAIPIQVEVIR